MKLPAEFINTVTKAFGAEGRALLQALPELVAAASSRWGLTEVRPVANLSYNFVAFARHADEDVVLKIGVPNRELTSGIAALRLFDGNGAARLLDWDAARGWLLLERLRPGGMLSALDDDEAATHIAAQVMLDLWRPAPADGDFIQMSDWFKGFERLRGRFEGGTGPLERSLVERAEGAVKDFFAEPYSPTLIHGDLHHFNILSSKRDNAPPSWLAIDPKGVVGPAAYEAGPLLLNPWNDLLRRPDAVQISARRIAILSERLGFGRRRLREWGVAHAVLSAWWGLEDGTGWEYPMQCAGLLAQLDLRRGRLSSAAR